MNKKNTAFTFIIILIILSISEGVSYYLLNNILTKKDVVYKPVIEENSINGVTKEAYVERFKKYNSLMGNLPTKDRYTDGSRITPNYPEALAPCVSLYGDSFTWSDQVGNKEAWGNVLSEKLKCRVANYGVGGYGMDQAFMLYQENKSDKSPVVVLSLFSEDIIRHITRHFSWVYNSSPFVGVSSKPRFIMDNGNIKLIPFEKVSFEEFKKIAKNPSQYVLHDYLLPGGKTGLVTLEFPYTLTALKVFNNYKLKARIFDAPYYEEFYDPNHPSQALQITEGILLEFIDLATTRNVKAVVAILPGAYDFYNLRNKGYLPYQPLMDLLDRKGVEYIDISENMIEETGLENTCELLHKIDSRIGCGAHYNARGYSVVAESIYDYILRREEVAPKN